MILIDTQEGMAVKIVGFKGGRGIEEKLRQLGIAPGILVRIVRHAPFDGPFLIEFEDREIALGKGVASRIIVEVQEN